MQDTSFSKVDKPDLGFTLALPEGWAEFPRPFSDSPFEVARFASRDHTSHVCIVYRMPGSRAPHLRGIAERSQAILHRKGFRNFALSDVTVGGQPGLLLVCDKQSEQGVWAAREYFVAGRNLVYCLGLGSGDPVADAPIFDSLAAHFQVS